MLRNLQKYSLSLSSTDGSGFQIHDKAAGFFSNFACFEGVKSEENHLFLVIRKHETL